MKGVDEFSLSGGHIKLINYIGEDVSVYFSSQAGQVHGGESWDNFISPICVYTK